MRDLQTFIEKETNKKINFFEYKNQDLKPNQELISFNNSIYIVEINDKNVLSNVSGYFYLIYQNNLDFSLLKNILENLYEDINITDYNNFLVVNSDY